MHDCGSLRKTAAVDLLQSLRARGTCLRWRDIARRSKKRSDHIFSPQVTQLKIEIGNIDMPPPSLRYMLLRAAPLLRVKAKITVTITSYKCSRPLHTAFLTVNLT